MRIIRHSSYIQQRKRRARWLALIGFAVLTSTLFIALNPALILPSYIAMLGGFVTFNIGMQQIGRWSRNPRNDQLLDRHLDKLGERYALVHYADAGGKHIDHVLIYPGGALVLTAKEIDGEISVKGNRWRRKSRGLRRLFSFSGPQLGNPGQETDSAVATLETFLEKSQLEIDVNGVIVFLHPLAELDVESPEYPVLHNDEVASFVHSLEPDESFSKVERDRLIALLSEGADAQAPTTTASRRRPVKRRSTATSAPAASEKAS
jgi:hypothetical protein